MAFLKDLIVNGSMRVMGTIFGSMAGKITISGKTYDGSSNVSI